MVDTGQLRCKGLASPIIRSSNLLLLTKQGVISTLAFGFSGAIDNSYSLVTVEPLIIYSLLTLTLHLIPSITIVQL